ncbi:MAG: prolyl oligopeptidase family serine peptidase [Thermomicrobiales bacterium]
MVNTVPPTRVAPVTEVLHGEPISDPYRWLEDDGSPETRAWVAAQNQYTAAVLDALPGRAALRERLARLLAAGYATAPQVRGTHAFFTRRDGTQNQPVLYVREGAETCAVLDPNTLSAGGTVALDWWYPSPDGALVAYGLSSSGDERSTLAIREVATGHDLPERIPDTRFSSVAWLPDGAGFYYTRLPAPGSVPDGEENYHQRVRFHQLGADPADDPAIFGEGSAPEDRFAVELSPAGRWLLVTTHHSWSHHEVHLLDRHAGGAFVPVTTGREAIYEGQLLDDRLYLLTNEDAPNFRVFLVNPVQPARANWREIVPERDAALHGCRAVGRWLALNYLRDAVSDVRVVAADGSGAPVTPSLPSPGTVASLAGEADGDTLFFTYETFFTPASIWRCELATGAVAPFEQPTGAPETGDLVAEQVWYTSRDGTRVPMFLLHRRDLQRDGQTPTLLTGYGGFNIALTPAYNAGFLAWIAQGGLVAQPSLRGGSEYGEDWHRAGMLAHKQTVFDDFLSAAEWLIAAGYTNRDHLGIRGGSNGGLLVGAALTQRPDVFRAVVCAVPLLDMLRYHQFLIARLWIPEYGSADDPEQFRWLRAYSPYHHVTPGTAYPAVLLTAAESDSRVHPLHARKMAALLQAATVADATERPVLLRLETEAGHGAGKPQRKILDEQTDIWSFLGWQLGLGNAE